MDIERLKNECLKIKGIKKVRTSKFKDGVFLYYLPSTSETTGNTYNFTDFIHLDTAKNSLKRTKGEYERFFL